MLDSLFSLGRRGWFWFWLILAVVFAGFVINEIVQTGDPKGLIVLLLVLPFLFLAFSARFLFTGRWRRDD